MTKSEKIMSVILNEQVLDDLPAHIALLQRGLYYGDSLFESIRVFDGRIPLWEQHWQRLSGGLRTMGYAVPVHWTSQYFKEQIRRMAPRNARLRLTVWRSPGGLYAPDNNLPNFLLTAQVLDAEDYKWDTIGVALGLCKSVRLPVDALSGLKALNAPRYVAAAQEAHTAGWDDAILLNMHDRVCETTASNLFWLEDSVFYTPPLSEGCVTGTLRSLLLTLIPEWGYAMEEKPTTFARLQRAEEVFLTNAIRGIRWVKSCEKKSYNFLKTKILHERLVQEMRQMNAVI